MRAPSQRSGGWGGREWACCFVLAGCLGLGTLPSLPMACGRVGVEACGSGEPWRWGGWQVGDGAAGALGGGGREWASCFVLTASLGLGALPSLPMACGRVWVGTCGSGEPWR